MINTKAFDSIPHSWILQSMKIYGLSPIVVNFIQQALKSWRTSLHLNHEKSTEIPIRCGFSQGNSFSPLLFCIALFPMSKILDTIAGAYKINNKTISHLFYMEILKYTPEMIDL